MGLIYDNILFLYINFYIVIYRIVILLPVIRLTGINPLIVIPVDLIHYPPRLHLNTTPHHLPTLPPTAQLPHRALTTASTILRLRLRLVLYLTSFFRVWTVFFGTRRRTYRRTSRRNTPSTGLLLVHYIRLYTM
jgi:hypothetical protein